MKMKMEDYLMNRDEAKNVLMKPPYKNSGFEIIMKGDANTIIDKIYDDFEKDLKEISNQVSRLKKQLSKGHHVECSCSFCKPVGEKVLKEFTFTSCDDCKNKKDGTYQEICSNCKRFYGCYFEAKEV